MSVLATPVPNVPVVAQTATRVMVVDGAVVVRTLLARWINEAPDLKVVAALRNGREAVDRFEAADPDVVVLDVEMPDLEASRPCRCF